MEKNQRASNKSKTNYDELRKLGISEYNFYMAANIVGNIQWRIKTICMMVWKEQNNLIWIRGLKVY